MFFSFVETNSSTAQQSTVPAKDGRTTSMKRKASPAKKTPNKRPRVSELAPKPQKTSEEDLCVREDTEEPLKKKKKSRFEGDKESPSTSVDTGRGRLIT